MPHPERHPAASNPRRILLVLALLATAASARAAGLRAGEPRGPASASPMLFPMAASVCDVLDAGLPACGREIIVGGDGVFPACSENPGDCVRDQHAHHFPFTYGANRRGGVHPKDIRDLTDRGQDCIEGNSAACDALPYLGVDDLVMSKTKVALLAALRKSTFPAFLEARLLAADPLLVQIPVIEDENCAKPLTGLEPDRVVAGIVTLEIRELAIEGSRRERFLRGVVTCGVMIDEPGDGPEDFGTDGLP